MSTTGRPYRLQRRAASAAATRQRLIVAARGLLAGAPLHRLALDEVARAAGVARSTAYAVFGSRRGLAQAIADDLLAAGDFPAMQQALGAADPIAALDGMLRVGFGLWAGSPAVVRQLIGLATLDAEVAPVVQALEEGRRVAVEFVCGRLAAADCLRPDLDATLAADYLLLVTSFPAFDELLRRGLTAAEAVGRLRRFAHFILAA